MNKRMRVYIAGAYSDTDVIRVLRNIGRGQSWGADLFAMGFSPFVPWHDAHFVMDRWTDDFNVSDFYEYSMDWLRVSDAVFVVPDVEGMKSHKESKGVQAEIAEAIENNIPVFYDLEELCDYEKQWKNRR